MAGGLSDLIRVLSRGVKVQTRERIICSDLPSIKSPLSDSVRSRDVRSRVRVNRFSFLRSPLGFLFTMRTCVRRSA